MERLNGGRFTAQVLAVFEHACDLVTPDGDVVALVTPQVGDGPLNVVVEGAGMLFSGAYPGAPVTLEQQRLCVGELGIDLGGAAVWDPCPDWDGLRGRRDAIVPRLPRLQALCLRRAPAGSFLALLEAARPGDGLAGVFLSKARKAAQALREGWSGDVERLPAGAAGLAGLGTGLTPAGDDFLVGTMLGAWLIHPAAAALCRVIALVAIPRTTALSAAFLQAAARGECGASWHALLEALDGGHRGELEKAVLGLLAHGATSGADALAGFLYLSLGQERDWRRPDLPAPVP